MYACNLFWNSTKAILDTLAAKGFVDEIDKDKKQKRYCITVKGRDVLGYFTGLKDLMQAPVRARLLMHILTVKHTPVYKFKAKKLSVFIYIINSK